MSYFVNVFAYSMLCNSSDLICIHFAIVCVPNCSATQGLLEETGRATPVLCKTELEAVLVNKNFGT